MAIKENIPYDELKLRRKLAGILDCSMFHVKIDNITGIERYNVNKKKVENIYCVRYRYKGKRQEIELKQLGGYKDGF